MTIIFEPAVMKGGSTTPISHHRVEGRYPMSVWPSCVLAGAGFRSFLLRERDAASATPPD